jgi:CP family cyanate transporter-like MFS transporter
MADGGNSDSAPAGKIRWLVLSGIWLLYFSFGLGVAGLAPLVQPIIRDLHMTHGQMGTVLGAWQFVYIFSAVPCGVLISRMGPDKNLVLAACIISASGFLRSVADDYFSLLAAVFLFGFGGPLISVGAPFVVAKWFRDASRGMAMGIYVTGPAIAAITVLLSTNSTLMPLFDENWRIILRLWAAIAFMTGVYWFCVTRIAGSGPATQVEKVSEITRLGELAGLLRARDVQLVLALSVGAFAFNHGLGNWLPELLRNSGLSAATAGYWAAIPVMVGVVGALIIPRFAVPRFRYAILAALFVAAGLAAFLLSLANPDWRMAALVLQGIAGGSMMAVLTLTLVESPHVGQHRAGLAGGLFFSFAEIGGVSGPVALGLFYDATGAFTLGLYVLCATAAVLVALTFILWWLTPPHAT